MVEVETYCETNGSAPSVAPLLLFVEIVTRGKFNILYLHGAVNKSRLSSSLPSRQAKSISADNSGGPAGPRGRVAFFYLASFSRERIYCGCGLRYGQRQLDCNH